ncbi:unnamed protein product [Coffea canephora]|uniref:Uncharacterized protein n=1 Tax=Coffea canephora TaxID=49390 RepID=A0A068UQ65_COFCA|nr:unnamed protein product [Coffea canephora]
MTSIYSQSTTCSTTAFSSSSASSMKITYFVHARPFVTPVRGTIKRRIFSSLFQKLQLAAAELQETLCPCNTETSGSSASP